MKNRARKGLVLMVLPVAVTAMLVSGCGGSRSTKSGTTGGTTGKTGTQGTVGVAIYPGTKPEQVYAGVNKMVTADGFVQVVTFYKQKLPNAVFSETTIPSGRGASFVIDNEAFHGNVSIEENLPQQGRVTITVSRFNSG